MKNLLRRGSRMQFAKRRFWQASALMFAIGALLPEQALSWTGCYFSDSKFSVELNAEKGRCGNLAYGNISSGRVRMMARTSGGVPLGVDILAPADKRGAAFEALPPEERYIIDCFSADDQPIKCAEVLDVSCVSSMDCPAEQTAFGSLKLSPERRDAPKAGAVEPPKAASKSK